MGKSVEIFANISGSEHKYMIVPFGVYLHKGIHEVRKGDIICCNEGWRVVKMEYLGGAVIKIKSPVFMFMLKSLYGENATVNRFFSYWSAICTTEGYGKNGFSRDEVMLVEVRELAEKPQKR